MMINHHQIKIMLAKRGIQSLNVKQLKALCHRSKQDVPQHTSTAYVSPNRSFELRNNMPRLPLYYYEQNNLPHFLTFRRAFSISPHKLEVSLLSSVRLFSSMTSPAEIDVDITGNCVGNNRIIKDNKRKSSGLKETSLESKIDQSRNMRYIVKYPLRGKGMKKPVFTENFERCKNFLTSLKVTTDELEFYPDIQEMEEDDIKACVKRLKESKINVVFSLFLIQRIFLEMNLEKTAVKVPKDNLKYWFKLRNGKYRLSCIQCIILYKELCQLLEQPNLDPVKMVEDLAAVGVYDHLETITNKTKKLRSVGAKAEDLLNNLELYRGSERFDTKIKLYQSVVMNSNRPFPVQLFLSSTYPEFRTKLGVDHEIQDLTQLLNVREEDFVMCWSFKEFHIKSLVHKVQMCLKAGFPRMEIFNNLALLDRIKTHQCRSVTKSIRKSGQPASVFVFKALENNIQHRVMYENGNGGSEPDWTCETRDCSYSTSQSLQECDIKKEAVTGKPETTNKASKEEDDDDDFPLISTTKRAQTSSKVWRRQVYKLIGHLLNLDRASQSAMFKTDINVDSTLYIDITNNLDFLMAHSFTKEDLRQCPIVLAHPSQHLMRVKKEMDQRLRWSTPSQSLPSSSISPLSAYSQPPSSFSSSSSSPSSSPPPSSLSSLSSQSPLLSYMPLKPTKAANATIGDIIPDRDISLRLLAHPVSYLNMLQYYLEKDTNFSLNYTHTQCVVEFLN